MSEERIAQLRAEILERTRELIQLRDAPKPFVPGETVVPYAGRVYDADEVEAGVSSVLDFWLALGPEDTSPLTRDVSSA
jgi:CDP-4-dehydro-6-deoxyglucose reductase, E1